MKEQIRFDPLPIASIEAMTACTARAYPRHTHDQYGIGVVDAGGHVSWSDRGQVEAGPGNLICVNPGEVHDGRGIGQRSRSWRLLYFDPALMDEACADIRDGGLPTFTFGAPVFRDDELRWEFDAAFAYSASASDSHNRMACETAILTLIARLQNHSTRPRNSEEPTPCVRRARDRIDADPAARLTLAALAGEAGLSRYQLIRGFARDFGLTPHAYIVQRRIALARQLIRAGRALAEVAVLAGFSDQSHLTRCFVRQFGIPPSRYAGRA